MDKLFQVLERVEGEDGRDFQARAFREAGSIVGFASSWRDAETVVGVGRKSSYSFGAMMREMLRDEGAEVVRYNPTGVYVAFNNSDAYETREADRAALYNPRLREERQRHIPVWRAPFPPEPIEDWQAAADDLEP